MSVQVYIGLGSNLDNPETHIYTALAELHSLALDGVVVSSPLYVTSPVGPRGQPDYVNAVAGFNTGLGAQELLDEILDIEQKHGRQRTGNQWGPRTLDLDLLLYGENVIQTAGICSEAISRYCAGAANTRAGGCAGFAGRL
jgi:2-amino-4-hydroxy-6-hydroxymethyldihydropteridine diphosphokinase